MSTITFNITYGNSDTGDLTLTANGDATVGAGDTIQWNLQGSSANTNIRSIDNVFKNSGSTNLFSTGPSRVGTSNNFSGTIENPIPPADQEEEYSINWTDAAGHPHTFDPKLTVNT